MNQAAAATQHAGAASGPARAGRKSREIRVGLVMYGGVSLAVYINGVAHEFFNAVRGRGVYRLLKALTDSDVVVDVVSGTSAGGINGILLGYALCNEREFAACANLWREHGDIARLVRKPAPAGTDTMSLLDSEGYYQPKLAGAFAQMPPCGVQPGEDVSPTEELDLFVTGTEVEGRRYTVLDDAGHAVDVKDHRTVFILKHRRGRKHPFDPAFNARSARPEVQEAVTHGALAKLGRITSCFPVAFAPVMVEHVRKGGVDADAPVERRIDALLTEWGALRRQSCFLDGGVLDNKPFTYTVREIFRRTAEVEVERRLFYVEPDPERFRQIATVVQPNVVEAAKLALLGVPAYESIAEDLKLLAERNTRIRTFKRLAASLEAHGLERGFARPSEGGATVYRRTRLVALSQRVVRSLLRVNGDDQLLDERSRADAEHLFREFDEVADRLQLAATLLDDFDIYYRLRRLFDLIDYCYAYGRRDPQWARLLWVLNRQIKLLDIVRNAMEQLLDEVELPWRERQAGEVWLSVRDALLRLLAITGADSPIPDGYGSTEDEALVRELLNEANRRLRQRIEDIKAGVAVRPAGAAGTGTSLLREADAYELRIIRSFPIDRAAWPQSGTPLERYERFEYLDAQLYPLEMFGEVSEKDEIRTVRISPFDAQRGFSRRGGEAKTAGQTLFHFGGFFKRSWRSNDILCGRLDATAQIMEEFFDAARIAEVGARPGAAAALQARLAADLDPAVLFPNAGVPAQTTLRQWLGELVEGRADPAVHEQNLTLLVEAAQLEILHEDLHKLVADEALEAREWEAPDERNLTPLSAALAAETAAARAIAEAAPAGGACANPRENACGRYFAQYGSATGGKSVLAAVPPLVLLETLARLLLIVRDAFMTALGGQAAALRRSALYKVITAVLHLFHGGVVFFRRAPPQAMAVMTGLGAAALVALLVGVLWWEEIISPPQAPFRRGWFVALVLVPSVILALQVALLVAATRARRIAGVLTVLVIAAAAAWLVWRYTAGGG